MFNERTLQDMSSVHYLKGAILKALRLIAILLSIVESEIKVIFSWQWSE